MKRVDAIKGEPRKGYRKGLKKKVKLSNYKKKMLAESPCYVHILDEMCKRVGTTFAKFPFKVDQWYCRHEWTEAEYNDYKEWLINYLYTNAKARREFKLIKNKKYIERAVALFMLDQSWKFKREDE